MTRVDPMTERQLCTATSKQTGRRCGSTPPLGFTVCQWHGGAAPQVKAKAEDRIRDMVDPALNKLLRLIDSDQDSTALAAVKDILDRAGYKPADRQEISGPNGGPMQTEDVSFSDDDRDEYILAVIERARKRADSAGQRPQSHLATAQGATD